MIVKNEADHLARCLSSVKDIADEMVVLDTGSTDETVAIAQSFGAQVQHFSWCDDFAAARNESLKYATGDWILVLDADEILVKDIIPLLQRTMQHPNALVINLVRQEIGATQSPYSLVSRLFRNHPEVHFSRPYHAIVDDSVAALLEREPQWQIVNLSEVAILHYGYDPKAIANRNKFIKAKTSMEKFLADHPDDPYVCSKLGALYVQMGDVQAGINLLERGLHASRPPAEHRSPLPASSPASASSPDAPVLYELHYHLGIACNRLQQFTQAEQHYRLAIQQPIVECLKLGAYNNLGSLLQTQGKFAEARAIYETCLAIDPNFAIGHYNLGMVLKAQGHLPQAVEQYQQAIALHSDYAEAYQNLGVALLKLGRVAESMQAFKQAIVLHQAHHNLQEAARLQQGLQEMGFRL